MRIPPQTVRELRTAYCKEGEREDLERQAGNHDVDAHLILGLSCRTRRDPATSSLQDEREQITATKNESVGTGPESTEVFPIYDDDSREGEVDSSAEERRGDGQADEVYEEVIACWIEWVLV